MGSGFFTQICYLYLYVIELKKLSWTPAHPLFIKAITEANEGYAPSYGSDASTEEAGSLIQKALKSKCKVFVVPTGIGANLFALKLCCKAYESFVCTDIAHMQY